MLKDKLKITYNLDEVAHSLEDGIRFLKEHGIDSAEIRTIDGKNIANLTIKETETLKQTLDSNGISVAAIASPLFKWYSGDSVSENKADLFGASPYLSREKKEKMIHKVIKQACILGTTKIRIFSGLKPGTGYYPLPQDESDLIIYALGIAKEKGVQLMMENEPVCYISKLKDYIEMFSSGKYQGLRAWFDIANVYEEGETIGLPDIEMISPFVEYLHVKDPVAPKNHKYVPLGQGYINYKRIFDLLEEVIKNPLYLSIETHVKDDKWRASHESLSYLNRLLTTKRTRYALVGLGRISPKHFSALIENDNCTLTGVHDLIVDKVISEAFKYDCTPYTSYEDLLNDPLVDVVSICTPHNTHIQLSSSAIARQKKVLCEKPLAVSSNILKEYCSSIDTDGNTHVVFQNRFNLAVKKSYEFEKGMLGSPQYIAMNLRWWRDESYYKDWHGSQNISGGPLITQAIHSLELVTHLTRGAKIKKVTSVKMKTREEISLPDIIVAIVTFDSGVVANIEVCLATRDRNLESSIFVIGSKGSMKVTGVALSEFVDPNSREDDRKNMGCHYYGNGHTSLYKTHSNHCLQIPDQDDSLLTRPEDIVKTMELIEAIEASF